MTYSFTVTKKEYVFILKMRQRLLVNYEVQEVDCTQCQLEHPANNISDIAAKVSILNAYYSTRVQVDPMVQNILKLSYNENLENRIQDGDLSVVDAIANTTRKNFSFATKYCALIQPDKYPIYDSLVWKFFTKLNGIGFFDKTTKKKFAIVNKKGKDAYKYYVEIYNEFIDKSGLRSFFKNYREVDAYIWGACEMYRLLNQKSMRTSIYPWKQWLSAFSSSLLSQLLATAIWHVLTLIKF